MRKTLTSNLRFGWTTGTCATAACHAAYIGLMTGECPKRVQIKTPAGDIADLEVIDPIINSKGTDPNNEWAQAGIIKDAGDDPDVTHGALIIGRLIPRQDNKGIRFFAGIGVGKITKPGLPLAVGEPAINPVPRAMMQETIENLAKIYGGSTALDIEISVPTGEALALKTWNPKLGIVGGISILGTTGVVRPFSCAAWIASIHRGIDVCRANHFKHVIAATGATSEKCALGVYDVEAEAVIDMGDFIGGMLKYMRKNPVPRLTIAGGFAKLAKFAQGANDLHSGRSQLDLEQLASFSASHLGIDSDLLKNCNTGLELLNRLQPQQQSTLCKALSAIIKQRVYELLRHEQTQIGIMFVARDGGLLCDA